MPIKTFLAGLLCVLLSLPALAAEPVSEDTAKPVAEKPKPKTPEELLAEAWRLGDYATIALYTRPMAKRGNARAQYTMGRLHFNGQGVAQDYTEAVQWLRLSAGQGYAPAQQYLATLCSRRPVFCR